MHADFESRLRAAVKPHDLLCHPFYQAWSMGTLTREDLAHYAAQYQHQVDALPRLLQAARAQTHDAETVAALDRNLSEELGQVGPAHAKLWADFSREMGVSTAEAAGAETRESHASLESLVNAGEVDALAALWTYEMQTAHVAKTKHEGLVERYGVTNPAALAFFKLHEQLDVHHASDLLNALSRACHGDAALEARACEAASRSAQAQWRFLDGAERVRLAA
ncbi:MAG: iron-containing redox enzyme family protein [Deltaproteobacteria bacterium]|nr:iron-containing redox enzyme family protein [Deltaproteobacteria bacterium]